METELIGQAQAVDFSMWALFARATITVKLVMLMLVVASFWGWAIIIQKHITLRAARREAESFDRRFDFDCVDVGPDCDFSFLSLHLLYYFVLKFCLPLRHYSIFVA